VGWEVGRAGANRIRRKEKEEDPPDYRNHLCERKSSQEE
jgi:hypothetical protein